jgi:hypothetical protein
MQKAYVAQRDKIGCHASDMRDSYSGSTAVSKTVDVGSIPTSRASV